MSTFAGPPGHARGPDWGLDFGGPPGRGQDGPPGHTEDDPPGHTQDGPPGRPLSTACPGGVA